MASRTPPTDPRLAAASSPGAAADREEAGVRPVVALPRSGPSGLLLALGMIAAAVILFLILESRRTSQSTPAVSTRSPDGGLAAAPPPPLYIPPVPAPPPPVAVVPVPVRTVIAAPPPPPPRPAPPPPRVSYIQPPAIRPIPLQSPPPPQRLSNNPILVVDTTTAPPAPAPVASDGASTAGALGGVQAGGRVRAGVFANKSVTVPQGTLIPAVLETAFDSTRPGLARAIVSRDVRGFDGTRVLVPRGSRLTGEYRSDIQPGQKRALINWTRLIRPDGITIALASPASDTLGRGGVSGHYNGHFWERFAGAILQSALDVGVNLATRAATSSSNLVVALPGSTQTFSPALLQSARIVPTITVPAGTSISVFVARDLDFSGAERAQ